MDRLLDYLMDTGEINKITHSQILTTDIINKKGALELVILVPGCEKENIHIEIKEHSLTVIAKSSLDADKKNEYLLKEIRNFEMKRQYHLPIMPDPEKVEAKLENGVLYLTIPKKNQEDAKKILIK